MTDKHNPTDAEWAELFDAINLKVMVNNKIKRDGLIKILGADIKGFCGRIDLTIEVGVPIRYKDWYMDGEVTGPAASVTSTGAVISGTLSSLGSTSSAGVSFNWGLTSSYGNTTAAKTLTSSNTFTATLTGLTPATTYHFRAVAAGSSTVYGSDITFTTAAAVTPPASTPPSTGNTTGVVASVPVSSGASNEYDLHLKVTSTTVSGVTVGQQVWLAASATEYPNLLTVGSTISGNLSNSPGWWIIK